MTSQIIKPTYLSAEDKARHDQLLQNLLNAGGDLITKTACIKDGQGYFGRFRSAFRDYNEWLKAKR